MVTMMNDECGMMNEDEKAAERLTGEAVGPSSTVKRVRAVSGSFPHDRDNRVLLRLRLFNL